MDIFHQVPDQDIFRAIEDFAIPESGSTSEPKKKTVNLNNLIVRERESDLKKIREQIEKNKVIKEKTKPDFSYFAIDNEE